MVARVEEIQRSSRSVNSGSSSTSSKLTTDWENNIAMQIFFHGSHETPFPAFEVSPEEKMMTGVAAIKICTLW